jgi:hypothetical protein
VTFTATIVSQAGGSVAGTVSFYNGTTKVGTKPVTFNIGTSSNQAVLTISSLPAGTDSIKATYSGDANDAGSTSSVLKQVVNTLTATTTSLTSSLNPSFVGQSVTFVATVTPSSGSGTPTGAVTFKNGSAILATVTLSGGTASFSTSSLTTGTHAITAVYSGDSNFSGSTSPALSQVVKAPIITKTTLTSSQNPSTVGQSVTFTATVTASSGTPDGTVTFDDGTTVLATVNLAAGVATYSTSTLAKGKHTIKAT